MSDAIILDSDDIIDMLAYNYSVDAGHIKFDGERYIVELPGRRENFGEISDEQ